MEIEQGQFDVEKNNKKKQHVVISILLIFPLLLSFAVFMMHWWTSHAEIWFALSFFAYAFSCMFVAQFGILYAILYDRVLEKSAMWRYAVKIGYLILCVVPTPLVGVLLFQGLGIQKLHIIEFSAGEDVLVFVYFWIILNFFQNKNDR